jgi:hypothetical protein
LNLKIIINKRTYSEMRNNKPTSSPPIEWIGGGFKEGQNPAATFRQGARSIADIQKSADAVREHSRDLGNRPISPSTKKCLPSRNFIS